MDLPIDSPTFDYPGVDGERVVCLFGRLSPRVGSGTVHASVEPSGCGRTTLLRCRVGLERPRSGSVEVVGERRRPRPTASAFTEPANRSAIRHIWDALERSGA